MEMNVCFDILLVAVMYIFRVKPCFCDHVRNVFQDVLYSFVLLASATSSSAQQCTFSRPFFYVSLDCFMVAYSIFARPCSPSFLYYYRRRGH